MFVFYGCTRWHVALSVLVVNSFHFSGIYFCIVVAMCVAMCDLVHNLR